MFALDHRRDFDALLAATEPFALVRFGDGEAALLDGRVHKAASDEWCVPDGLSNWMRERLAASLARVADGYCIGLPPGCCLRGSVELHHRARVPDSRRTFATLFLHGNLGRMHELVRRYDPVVVGKDGDIAVPANAVEHGCDVDSVVAAMLDADRPLFVSAGPLANILIDSYWQRQEITRRQIVLDVGSAFDYFRSGHPTRYYHGSSMSAHHCTLQVPVSAPPSSITHRGLMHNAATSSPVRAIGRRGTPVSTARNVERDPGRAATVVSGGQPAAAQPPALTRSIGASEGAAVGGVATLAKRGRCANCVKVVRQRR